MTNTQFEFLDNLVNRTIYLKAVRFGDEIWELEAAGLISLKWDGEGWVAKPTLAGRERIEREFAQQEAEKTAHQRDAELKAALERERDEARHTAECERNERRIWQGATILAMVLSAGISAYISAGVPSCSCHLLKANENKNASIGFTNNPNDDRMNSVFEQNESNRIAEQIGSDVVATNLSHSSLMQSIARPTPKNGENKTKSSLSEKDTESKVSKHPNPTP